MAAKFSKLVDDGFPENWARVLKDTLADGNQILKHAGPVTIKLSQDRKNPSVGSRTKKPFPADANKSAPALTVAHYGGRALHSQSGNVLIEGHTIDPNFATVPNAQGTASLGKGDRMNVTIPSVYDHYVWFNYPIMLQDDLRMGQSQDNQGLIIKYALPSYASSVRRFKLLTDISGGQATAIPIDWLGNVCGIPFTVYESVATAGLWSCGQSGNTGYAYYFSDGANLGATVDGLPPAAYDCAHRPNDGNWEIAALSNPSTPCTTFDVVSKVCCINGSLVVCTKSITICGPCPVGVLDCGGTAMCD